MTQSTYRPVFGVHHHSQFNRRSLLALGGAALALTACKDKASKAAGSIAKIGLQTYSLRTALGQDFLGTLKMIKSVGYDYVELNDRNFSDQSPEALKAMLDEAGLPSPASHIGYDRVVADPKGVAKTAKTLGCKYMIIPYMGEDQRALSDWKRHAAAMNASGKVLRDAGVKLAYHNHQFEFEDLGGGTTAMDILINETDADLVDFELDLFWTALAKVDAIDVFKMAPGRFKLCHVKDLAGDPWTATANGAGYEEITRDYMVDVGQGEIDFKRIFAQNALSGMEYFIAEHDNPKTPYRNAIATSEAAIRAMRF